MDDMKKRRLAAGLPVQIGRGEHSSPVGKAQVFDFEKDLTEHPFKWKPEEEDLHLLPDPLRTWALTNRPEAAKPRKRKQASTRPVHSISQRRQAIARHQAGESYAAIAADYGVPRSTIINWCRRGLQQEPFIEQLNAPASEAPDGAFIDQLNTPKGMAA